MPINHSPMTEVLPPPNHLSHLMCSQNGTIQDLAALNDHSSSSYIGAESDSESSSRQDYSHPPPLSDMGLRYVTIPSDDVRFPQDSVSHSPLYSIEPTVQNAPTTSSLSFSQYPNVYQPAHNLSAYSNGHGGSAYFPQGSVLSIPDIKPRLGSLISSPALAPFSRSPALSNITSTLSARDLYSSHTPSLYRRPTSDLLTRSPNSLRSPLSPSSHSGFTSPISLSSLSATHSAMDPSNLGSNAPAPPLQGTEVYHYLTTSSSEKLTPEIFGRIEKGFFMADGDWTCYRRNYFSLNCSYTLQPAVPQGTIYLRDGAQVHGFAMSIAAVVDGRDGKSIELVQHTPKRDKGPQEKPARITLAPRPSNPSSHGHYSTSYSDSSSFSAQITNPSQPAMEATFERIQFKNATANNGKRRAAQQYYHLLVELFADVGTGQGQSGERWVKIASRMSAPMVVRGRSPGHYQGERRGSNTSTGGPGSGGVGGGAYTPGAGSSGRGDVQMGGMGSLSMSGGYVGYDSSRGGGHYTRTPLPLNIPMEPTLSQEEAKSIEESPCYLYYPAAMWEGGPASSSMPSASIISENRVLPSLGSGMGGNDGYKVKKEPYEYGSGGYTLPSITQEASVFGRNCGRWEGVDGSRGFFPSVGVLGEMNIT